MMYVRVCACVGQTLLPYARGFEGPRTGGPGRRHDRPPGVRGRPGKWPKSDEFSKCEQPLRGVNSSQAGCGAAAPQGKFCVLGH